ncbi:MAG: serine protease, partial [Verrucomicrobiota bacterium]
MGFEDFLKDILGGGGSSSRHAQQMPQLPELPPVGHGEEGIGGIMHAVVQIVALKQGLIGGMSSAWTGSGTIVHPAGVILTNCHVANPRAMGMSSPSADRLGISITERSDAPPALTYFAQIVAQAPELDLAVLRIISTVNGQRVGNLNLPCVEIGDSDRLELGDRISILGYPGIGGETVTFTAGNVSGFSSERGVNATRAWVKTDATIAGGNSGGTGVNEAGFLIGIPTQAAAGTGITPVDARPVLDTNRDGRIDRRDTPMAIGGFINGLRPVNLAIPLLEQAGMQFEQDRGQRRRQAAVRPAEPVDEYSRHMDPPAPRSDQSNFRELLFSSSVTDDGRPINPVAQIPEGAEQIFATFEYSGMNPGTPWSAVWTKDGQIIIEQKENWDDDRAGRKAIKIN